MDLSLRKNWMHWFHCYFRASLIFNSLAAKHKIISTGIGLGPVSRFMTYTVLEY